MKWVKGRQSNFEYYKMKLYSFRLWKLGLDGYIINYPNLGSLPEHTDPVVGGKHYRLNIRISGHAMFCTEKGCTFRRITFFRPDIQTHWLRISYGGCKKLSFGFVIYK